MPPERGSGEERRQCPLGSGVREGEACPNEARRSPHAGLALVLVCVPVSGRQVPTSSPVPAVPPGTQGLQLLLGLVPAPGGRGGQRGLG